MSVRADTRRPVQAVDKTSSTPVAAGWRAHPFAAKVLRLAAVLTPVAASVGAVVLVNLALPRPRSWESFAAVALVDIAVAFTVLLVINAVAVRVLPLATLLSLSLVFPDRAPKRFAIALRANSTSQLRSRLITSRHDIDVATALEDLLTYLAALSRHDRMTRGHCERVRAFVDLLAVQMDLCVADQERLRWAALFHDIGKLRVPGPILRKPGKPTDKEWATLKRHPVDGAEIIRPLTPWLGEWADAVEQHHERFDGQGYPSGLGGTDISLGGRILAVADAYEVMITSRPYKRPVRPEAARRELVRHAGQQFDPEIVRAFLGIAIGDLRKVMGFLGVLSEVPLIATVPRAEALIEMAGRQTIGAVGSAAGAGVFVAAATLAPVHSASPSSAPPNPVTHAAAASPAGNRAHGNPPESPGTPPRPDTPGQPNDGQPSSDPVNPGTGSSTSSHLASEPNVTASVAPSKQIPTSAITSLPAHVSGVGAVETDIPVPAAASTMVSNLAPVTKDAVPAVNTAAEGVASTADSAVADPAKAAGEDVEVPPGP